MDKQLRLSIKHYLKKKKSIDTPQIFFDTNILRKNYKYIHSKLAEGKNIIYYAVKANNDEQVLKELLKLGSSFEIASLGELNLLSKIGVSAKKIFFSNPVKLPHHIKKAYDFGIRCFAVDSMVELEKVSKLAPGSKVYIRLAVENGGSKWKLDLKFGAGEKEARSILLHSKRLGLNPAGITFHVGWNNNSTLTWVRAIRRSERLIKFAQKLGINLNFLNLGGGFPAHLVDQKKELKRILHSINPIILKIQKKYNLEILAEPGTWMVANCAALVVRIYSIIKRGSNTWVFVDSPMNQGFYWILAGLKYDVSLSKTSRKEDLFTYTVAGPTCDSKDIFAKDILLPRLQVGDLILVSPAGAYIASNREYNMFSYPGTIHFDGSLIN